MPDRTPKGFPYPLGDDAITDYPAVGRDLAERVDGILGLPAGTEVAQVPVWNGSAWVPVSGIATGITPPANTTPPAFSAAPKATIAVTRTAGVWAGSPAPTVVWRWLLDGAEVQAGGDSYTPPADSVGKTLVLQETATSSFGTASAQVSATIAPAWSPPANGTYLVAGSVSFSEITYGVAGAYTGPLVVTLQGQDPAAHGYILEIRLNISGQSNPNSKAAIVRQKNGTGWYSADHSYPLTSAGSTPWYRPPMTAVTAQYGFDAKRSSGGTGYTVVINNPTIEWRYLAP